MAWTGTVLLYVGGTLLILGFLARLIVLPLIVHMILAIALVDRYEGLAPRSGGGMQIALLVIAALLVVLTTGPGPLSLDFLLGWDNGWDVRAGQRPAKCANGVTGAAYEPPE